MLRWIDELNGLTDADAKARAIKLSIRKLKRGENSVQNRRQISQLYAELDEIQFKPDYMCLIIDKDKDYYRACKGFSINGVEYHRLLGTNGGIKNSTIVFVSKRLWPELNGRIENGRNTEMPLVTAKLEAYKALTCSASTPVSMPRGVLVVPDAETNFTSNVIYLTDDVDPNVSLKEGRLPGEPLMEFRKNEPITLDASDGFGIMLPELAERWRAELGLRYTVSGLNCRYSFTKGMIFTFDFLDFAEKVAGTYIVKDAWGDEVDIRDVDLILTTSMVKLWDSYESCTDFLTCSILNGYTFAVTKTCPEHLEAERTLNYQYIQCLDLSDDDIEELIAPTMQQIKDILAGDWRKTTLFLKGSGLNENNVPYLEDDYSKALMIEPKLIDDPFVRSNVYQLIKNRINQAKVGVLNVHGNYSIVCGDPYLLCESIFGLPVKGLLRAGEIYNQYWADAGATSVACFRAPMSCANNILRMTPADNDEVRYWFQYIKTGTVLNGWDTATMALNG